MSDEIAIITERPAIMAVELRFSRPRRLLATMAVCICLGLPTGACSLSFPMPGFASDDSPTGSINKSAAALSPALDKEDWRRAKAALAVALDPQGNGANVAWDNPQSGAKGSFVALAPPFLEKDRICRAFKASVSAAPAGQRRLGGSACRSEDGAWVLAEVKEQK